MGPWGLCLVSRVGVFVSAATKTVADSHTPRQATLLNLRGICYRAPPLLHSLAMPRQRLGQHFLSGQVWQRRILDTLPRDPASAWIEIGSGHGEMTRQLAPMASRVVTIETDTRLADRLRE